MEYKPYYYQDFAEKFILDNPEAGLLLDMGMGKTVTSLSAADKLLNNYFAVSKVLVIAPLKPAKETWPPEVKKWDHLKHLKLSLILGSKAERIAACEREADIYIVNRENVVWLVDFFKSKWPFDMVIIDELSSFKSSKAQRFRALKKVRKYIKRIVGLTGTPSPNGLLDLWPEMYLLDEGKALGKTLTGYRDTYFVPDKRNATTIFSWKPKDGAEELMFEVTERRSENKMVVTIGNRSNTYYLFGGRDESSYTLIQGITLAGVLFDEVALMPRSFVEQAMARCSVSGSKFWFNCNPESPGHWFYKEWIRKAAERNMLYLHFTMDDNLSLDEKIKARYEGMYSGVFYDRYIRGLWTVAEGLIYTMFNKDYHVVPSVPRDYEEYLISCDYGTLNPTSAGLWGLCEGKWYRVREYYYDGRKERYQRTDEEHYAAIKELAGDLSIRKIIVDPSAASFIEVIRRHDRFMVEQASNRVLDGIRDVATRLNAGDIFFCDCCTDCIREFGLYRWDEKAAEDRPLKTDDHAMDDTRYFVRAAFQPSRFSF